MKMPADWLRYKEQWCGKTDEDVEAREGWVCMHDIVAVTKDTESDKTQVHLKTGHNLYLVEPSFDEVMVRMATWLDPEGTRISPLRGKVRGMG